ncbi:hypothetical protein PUN28_009136 [Cardiocondyla obscurior]|uniref:Secreted protein n=1 Tax=Cardiocondyla obscurior TaxID=286306 RepID=A0AAW2FWG3_9HYME
MKFAAPFISISVLCAFCAKKSIGDCRKRCLHARCNLYEHEKTSFSFTSGKKKDNLPRHITIADRITMVNEACLSSFFIEQNCEN